MAKNYTPFAWLDEILAGLETYLISGIGAGQSISLDQTVTQAGSAVNASRLNNIEGGILQNTPTTSAVAPTVNEDLSSGYLVGDRWVDTVTDTAYVCVDNTNGAAIWSSASGDLLASNNLSDLDNAATARTNLGVAIGTDVLAEQTIGIADNNLLEVDDAAAADNEFARFTANGLEGQSNLEVRGDLAEQNAQTGTTYTTVDGDNGKVITLNNAAGITLTIHSGALADFHCMIVQKGAGQVTVAAGGTGNIRNFDVHTKLAGQYAMGSIWVESNAGTAPEVYFSGNTGA